MIIIILITRDSVLKMLQWQKTLKSFFFPLALSRSSFAIFFATKLSHSFSFPCLASIGKSLAVSFFQASIVPTFELSTWMCSLTGRMSFWIRSVPYIIKNNIIIIFIIYIMISDLCIADLQMYIKNEYYKYSRYWVMAKLVAFTNFYLNTKGQRC